MKKRNWILTLVGLLMSISSFQSVKAQLNLIPQGFDSSGTHPQAFRFIIEGHSSFDSVAIVDNQSRPSYPRMVDTGWVINEATVTSVIETCQRGHGHRQIWGNCTIPDSITWVVDSWTTEVCTTAYYVNVPHLSVQSVFSHRTSRWPTQCWLQKPKGTYARTKPGKPDINVVTPHVNSCGDTTLKTVIYDEDLWESVSTPAWLRDTVDYRVYPNGTQEWTYGSVPRMVGEIDTVLVMVEGYSSNAMTFRREYAFIINWISRSFMAVLPTSVKPVYHVKNDFDGDGKSDIWDRNSTGDFHIDYAYNGFGGWDWTGLGFGTNADTPDPGDFDGDGMFDIAVLRNSDRKFLIDYAANGFWGWEVTNLGGYGGSTDYPCSRDYDGDTRCDISVRDADGDWHIDYAANGFGGWDNTYYGYGGPNDRPAPANYDGIGGCDFAVLRNSDRRFLIDYAANGFGGWDVTNLGGYGGIADYPCPDDYNHDGKDDIAVLRTSDRRYLVDHTGNGFNGWDYQLGGYGGVGDRPIPGDYDGNGWADVAVYHISLDRACIDYGSNTNNYGSWDWCSAGTGLETHKLTEPTELPISYQLMQNYPNPFNPVTTIQYSLGEATRVRLDIINILGEVVMTIVDQAQSAGTYQIEWDGANTAGTRCASGVYFYRIVAGDFSKTRKMILLK